MDACQIIYMDGRKGTCLASKNTLSLLFTRFGGLYLCQDSAALAVRQAGPRDRKVARVHLSFGGTSVSCVHDLTDDQVVCVQGKLVATRCSRVASDYFPNHADTGFELSLDGDFVTVVPIQTVNFALHMENSGKVVSTEDVPVTGADAGTSGCESDQGSGDESQGDDVHGGRMEGQCE